MNWSELSTTRPMAGESPRQTRREYCAGMMTAASILPVRTSSRAFLLVVVGDGGEGADVGRDGIEGFVESSAPPSRGRNRQRPSRAPRIFPPKALPRIMSCTSGSIIDTIINAGERKNLRISRSTIAIIRFMVASPDAAAS